MMINLYVFYRIYIICDVNSVFLSFGTSSTQLEVLGREGRNPKKKADKEIRPQKSAVSYISEVKA